MLKSIKKGDGKLHIIPSHASGAISAFLYSLFYPSIFYVVLFYHYDHTTYHGML